MNEDLLLVLGIIEANFVISLAARRRVALDSANFVVVLVFRVGTITEIGRHLIGVVDASYDDRLVWVTFFERDNYLLPGGTAMPRLAFEFRLFVGCPLLFPGP